MKRSIFTAVFCLVTICYYSQTITRLIGGSQADDSLRVFDTLTYAQVGAKALTFSTGNVDGITGLSKKASTGVYYAIVKSQGTRYLGSLNPATGSITPVGDLQDAFAGITFNANNTLIGITGSGASNPNSIYRINTTNASKTFVASVFAGNGGQAICFNPLNNKVYQFAGFPFSLIEHDTTFTSSNNITVNSTSEVFGTVYKSNNSFIVYDINAEFVKVHNSGPITTEASFTNMPQKGLAYITCQRTITATSLSICSTGQTTLTMNSGGISYQWFKNNTILPGATSATYIATGGGYYRCMIDDACGKDSTAGVIIQSLTSPTVALSGNGTICAGQTATLTGSSGGTSQWYRNGVPVPGANTNTIGATTSGIYNMIKTNQNGCADSSSTGITVVINAYPSITVTASSNTLCPGKSATLTASGGSSYTWTSNIVISTTSVAVVSPTISTTYTVIVSNQGCQSSQPFAVVVNTCVTVAENTAPPAISMFPNPAQDGVQISAGEKMSFIRVFDITGKLIIEKEANGEKFMLQTWDLDSGIYITAVTMATGRTAHSRLVIKR